MNAQILEEAAEWFVELDGDAADFTQRQAFDAWLRRSPEHVKAFLELLPIWEEGADTRLSQEHDEESLIALAFNARSGNVFPLLPATPVPADSAESSHPLSTPAIAANVLPVSGVGRERRGLWATLAAACLLAALGMWLYGQRHTYSTQTGEQRSIALEDGSTVNINSRSRVRVNFSGRERNVELLEGQALFQVTKDPNRPFVVSIDNARVRAVGTQFDVYRKQAGTVVTVLEGRVAVTPPSPQSRSTTGGGAHANPAAGRASPSDESNKAIDNDSPVFLSAGEQTVVTQRAVEQTRSADVAAATAWTQRRLMFQKTSLAEVVEEFNRYNTRLLRIEDPATQEFLVSGTFSSTDPASLLRFLREQPGIRVIETDRSIRIASAP